MNLDKYIKSADYILTCPFCAKELSVIDDKYFTNNGQIGYECTICYVVDVKTISGKPFSRYNIGVMKNIQLGDQTFDQIIVDEIFYIYLKDNQWYNIRNNLIKQQTSMVLTEPTRPEHIVYNNEPAVGLTWVSDLVILPFIDSWDLTDQEKTVSKIHTYLLFS